MLITESNKKRGPVEKLCFSKSPIEISNKNWVCFANNCTQLAPRLNCHSVSEQDAQPFVIDRSSCPPSRTQLSRCKHKVWRHRLHIFYTQFSTPRINTTCQCHYISLHQQVNRSRENCSLNFLNIYSSIVDSSSW